MKKYSSYLFTLLRILIGWHFLYEGISKLINPGWTAKYYLLGFKWIFAGLFHWMASSQAVINVVDFLNVWGLILIGLSLFIGLFVRWSSIAGAVLLFFYFAAYPPIFGYTFGVVAEGNYQWVDKNLIELIMLVVLASLPARFSVRSRQVAEALEGREAQCTCSCMQERMKDFPTNAGNCCAI